MSSASTSTTSFVSGTTVTSSRARLTAGTQPKNFQAAFASLQSTYGFAGSVPMPPPTTARSTTPSCMSRTATNPHVPSSPPKDFQSAFAELQLTYGFSGSVPSPAPAPKNRGSSGSLLLKLARVASAFPKPQASTSPTYKIRHVPRPSPHVTTN
ncbi:hypothetical protein DFH07DRAFT_1055494 [Mycena maculata]|uniref:Uncharacterized protein n=1 Tax=Mycena maculata TaxID=230809 RepID=A0AAD7KB79_9AGAR|nr:hypothetical protein DFH07DRAFT_1055494 [Mycena maculata]